MQNTLSLIRPRFLRSRLGAFILVCLIGFFLTACSKSAPPTAEEQIKSSSAELREILVSAVDDAGRLKQMLAISDQASLELESAAVELEMLRQERSRLNLDYSATQDEFQGINNRLLSLRQETRSKVLRARLELAQLATDAEWKKISSRDLAILKL